MNPLELALLELKERSDSAVYFEKNFKIKDRDSETGEMIPFKINSSQRKLKNIIDKWEKQKVKYTLFVIILKARRRGFSTYVQADFFKRILHEKNKTAMVISFDDDSAKNINDMANLLYQHLPNEKKPYKRESRGQGVILENPKYVATRPESKANDPGLQSKFLVETAKNVSAGSSYNINYLHISEIAKWNCDIERTMTSLLQAVPIKNSIVIIESTALGYNYFKDLWDDANKYIHKHGKKIKFNNHVPLFVPWFDDEGYVYDYDGFELDEYEKDLKEAFKLTNEQLAWRRWCINNKCKGNVNVFKQEYPATPKEAFLATGAPVFDNEQVELQLEKIKNKYEKEPPITGMFQYTYQTDKGLFDIKFVKSVNGLITIYQKPKKGYPYVLGGDTSGEGSDKSGFLVIDNTNGQQCMTLHGKMDSDLFAEQCYCAGKYYNDALIVIEMNFDPGVIKRLQQLNYWHMYKRETIDAIVDVNQNRYGFRTTTATRPVIINNLVAVAREQLELFVDIVMLEEMLEFAYDKMRKPVANPGKNDDMVMTGAITYFGRNQMWTIIDEDDDEEEDMSFIEEDDEEYQKDNWYA